MTTEAADTPPVAVAIAIMARSPVGRTAAIKTRLAGVLPRESDRLALYLAFLSDTIATCRGLDDTALRIAVTPPDGMSGFDALGVEPTELLPQRGDDLGARERHLFEDMFAAGFDAVVIVGSDLPTVPHEHLRQAVLELRTGAALVLGPSDDGGYYVMGLRRRLGEPVPDLFSRIRWSTRWTLDDTVRAARDAGLEPRFITAWYDVDDEEGWRRLCADLADPTVAAAAPRTAEVVRAMMAERRRD
jgi:hypothetical protein